MDGSRISNTKRNILFSSFDTVSTLVFQFVLRLVVVQTLGTVYLGLSGLFVSILQILNMADLGFSGAIVYNMYRPLAENDTDAVCKLLNYYKKIYRVVSVVVLCVGLALAPFIKYLIKDPCPDDINVYCLYFLYLANSVVSYAVFAYRTALLNALQRLDLTKAAYLLINTIQYLLQILSLVVFRNYYLFVICMIAGTAGKNAFSAYLSKKKYSQYVCRGTISEETKKSILSRVKGLLVCSISAVTYTTFDNIVLSAFVGLGSVAIYSNYLLIHNGIAQSFTLIRESMQASVGNSVAKENVEKNYNDMKLWQFLFSVIATWMSACLMSMYQPFMKIWMGEDMLLREIDVVLLVIWFFATMVQNSFFLYLSGNGLWWEMRYPYIFSTITNLILNILLGSLLGVTGIIIATVIASVVFGMIWQCSIIFRTYFNTSMLEFQKYQLLYTGVCILCCGIAYGINEVLNISGIVGLAVRFIICSLVAVSVQILIYRRTEMYKDSKVFIKRVMHRQER